MTELALSRRADLQASRLAVTEAEANLGLVRANRFGNPSVGPAYTYDPTGVNMIGAQINVPLPFVNSHRGEILEAREQHVQTLLLLRQAETNVRQDVVAALAKLEVAEDRAQLFRQTILPELRKAVDLLREGFLNNLPGADLQRLIDVRRKLLRNRDAYLDALWSVRQARADLLGAIGEPAFDLARPPRAPAKP